MSATFDMFERIKTPWRGIEVLVVGYQTCNETGVWIKTQRVSRRTISDMAAMSLDTEEAATALEVLRADATSRTDRMWIHEQDEAGVVRISRVDGYSLSLPRETWITVLTAVEAAVKGGAA